MRNTYFILRHGQTVYQTEKKEITYPWPESSPVLLTGEGMKQVKAATKKIKSERIDFIYSSDVSRARQTAEIVAKEVGLKIIFDPRLRDINLGIFKDGFKENFLDFFSSQKQRFFKRPPQGESWNDIKERMTDFIKEIDKKHQNKRILIISHGDPLWILEGLAKGLTDDELLERESKGFYPKTGQFQKLEFSKNSKIK